MSGAAEAFARDVRGRYATVLADPPWRFQNRRGKSSPEHGRLYRYPTLSVEEVRAIPVGAAAEERSHLYLWAPNALIPEALTVMQAWGFTYKTVLTWVKMTAGGIWGGGLGWYYRNATEALLFGVRGGLRTLAPGRTRHNVIAAPRTKRHSEKPDAAYRTIEACSPAPRLEVFARAVRAGWSQWGNEMPPTSPAPSA